MGIAIIDYLIFLGCRQQRYFITIDGEDVAAVIDVADVGDGDWWRDGIVGIIGDGLAAFRVETKTNGLVGPPRGASDSAAEVDVGCATALYIRALDGELVVGGKCLFASVGVGGGA